MKLLWIMLLIIKESCAPGQARNVLSCPGIIFSAPRLSYTANSRAPRAPAPIPVMLLLETSLRDALRRHLQDQHPAAVAGLQIALETPPRPELGDFASPLCFELARRARRPPRQLAQEIQQSFVLPPGFVRLEAAAGGYLNFFLDRPALLRELGFLAPLFLSGAAAADPLARLAPFSGAPPAAGLRPKVIVEHTNINPNKAAHIGHLRNAVLGDTLVRLLRRRGERVEVQNYIDNTGVQVADVAAAFAHRAELGADVPDAADALSAALAARHAAVAAGLLTSWPHYFPRRPDAPPRPAYSFDYLCWDVYARISQHYQQSPASRPWRAAALHAIEAGQPPFASAAHQVADAVVAAHLATMARINVAYDLLPRESEILHLDFWARAFALLRQAGAVRLETAGKNAGCWVMDRPGASTKSAEKPAIPAEIPPPDSALAPPADTIDAAEAVKIVVRSDGTVTYIGKDIAYQLWKFGLLGLHLPCRRFQPDPASPAVWMSDTRGEPDAPAFGDAARVFNVIDSRQSDLQEMVAAGLLALGHAEAARNSRHFSYEMVALTPRCAEELGFALTAQERARPHVEVSGRKGLGVKADDLIDRLLADALAEVSRRHPSLAWEDQFSLALPIAVGALRYFLLKFTRNTVIAFDFQEALSFEGETGPYVQYAAVRAANILRKSADAAAASPAAVPAMNSAALPADNAAAVSAANPSEMPVDEASLAAFAADDEFWPLIRLAARLDSQLEISLDALEPAHMAKYAFALAQNFNNFYHRHAVLAEADPARRRLLLKLTAFVRQQLVAALALLGINAPRAM